VISAKALRIRRRVFAARPNGAIESSSELHLCSVAAPDGYQIVLDGYQIA
jgi:hypothetical protein